MSLLVECMTGVPKEPGSIPGWGEFFHLNSFQRGNETNGKEHQQQLKKFLGLWPMAAEKIQEILEGGCGGGGWVEISLTKAEGSGSIPVCHTN